MPPDALLVQTSQLSKRYGPAMALDHKDPHLLILDEPTNGLDPAGMAEMRALIRRLTLATVTGTTTRHRKRGVD